MTPGAEILVILKAAGLHLRAQGGSLVAGPRDAITDELRGLIRAHKSELLAALASDSIPNPQAEACRQRVFELLAANPSARYALLTDLESDAEAAIVALGMRGHATCEFRIPRDKYDGPLLLDLIERHGATMH